VTCSEEFGSAHNLTSYVEQCTHGGGETLSEHKPGAWWPSATAHVIGARHYKHAPIVEAILDIRCEVAPNVVLDDLLPLVDELEYPARERAMSFHGQLDLTQDPVLSQTSTRHIGHVFRRVDGQRVVQARLDGFAFSWLPPYDDWDAFTGEAEAVWLRYRELARPTRVTRIATRFVNKVDVPSAPIEIKDYLRVAVDVPAYLPQAVSRYFLQVEMPLEGFECSATVSSTFVPPPVESATSLVLDVDTWQVVDIPLTSGVPATEVPERLAILRQAKNYVFESCITDATRGLID
jgi:uncharacterized protein (TIGR04255 family)